MGADMTDQTEREALASIILMNRVTMNARWKYTPEQVADAILAAGFHRTPTPHVVTTVEELEEMCGAPGFDPSLSFLASDGFPHRWDDLHQHALAGQWNPFPATVLTPAPAPEPS